jgi:gamma-glutamylcysteine synthetase
MDILETILFVLLFSVSGYFIYEMFKLNKALIKQNEDQRKALAEAGNAITDTLRVAFDNLKRNTAEHNKINAKLNEHSSRIHRIEQHNNRNIRDGLKRTNIIEKEKEDENE